MTDLLTLLRHTQQKAALAAIEREISIAERAYWTERGFSVLPRRERLLAALREDAARLTPLEMYIEQVTK